jgi:CDP-glycerol glycerophosphotransferase (TagB/SpsB family)
VNIKKPLNILVIMNPIGKLLCSSFLQIIYYAIKDMDVNLIIKLHPSSEHYDYLPQVIFKDYSYKIFRLENTHDLIRISDVVISTTSTVGAETIALNKPLIQVKLNEINTKLAYEDYDCCISVNNHIELEQILNDEKEIYSKFGNYDSFISDFFYKLDSNSSKRIKKEIES